MWTIYVHNYTQRSIFFFFFLGQNGSLKQLHSFKNSFEYLEEVVSALMTPLSAFSWGCGKLFAQLKKLFRVTTRFPRNQPSFDPEDVFLRNKMIFLSNSHLI